MKRVIKVILALLAVALIIITVCLAVFLMLTKDVTLDEKKLTNFGTSITICDGEGNEITNASLISGRKSVLLKDLSNDTVNAFISSEDRSFFNHRGINYKRMAKALYTNIASRSFKEGASTISQQLIKNTHLTGDKTINRKLKEIKLTSQLEDRYSKEQILEMYLNTIYFGHNCYGLESASEFYFGKTASALTLEQSAAMAGLLASPNNYSPFKNPEKCTERRNLVLKSMQECGYITEEECVNAQKSPLSAQKGEEDANDYLTAVFEEFEQLDLDYYSLAEATIKTCLDDKLQKYIESLEYSCDNSVIVTSADSGVKAYKSTINGAKRQPGSTIKPLWVYGPSIEEKIALPATKILDEKVNYNGYSPENYDKKYHGYVTLADSIKYSYNVPAVKTLNALTIDKAEKYANKFNITIEKEEKNLALALGGMKHGLKLKELCDMYTTFANGGNYSPSHFIEEITLKDGTTVYKAEKKIKKVFSESTCSLMNDMLMQTSKEGTAKKLKDLPYDAASKTGTCGNSNGNTDAYCITYTSSDTVGVWLGDKDNTPLKITGGTNGAELVKEILKVLYAENSPARLDTTTGTIKVNIDRDEYNKNNKIMLADIAAPKLNLKEITVPKDNAPKMQSSKYSNPTIEKPQISVKNNTVLIKLCQTYYYSYLIKRENNGSKTLIYDGEWIKEFEDAPDGGTYVYTVTPYYSDEKKVYYGKTVRLPAVNISVADNNNQKDVKDEKSRALQEKLPDIVHREWYNE